MRRRGLNRVLAAVWRNLASATLGLGLVFWGLFGESEVVGQSSSYSPPRCEILPLPRQEVSFQIDGHEKLRWHYDSQYPRPFFYPFRGPSGESLTRMGHPGAQNHDHHRSVWFAHHKVDGIDFWSDQTEARIRQTHWYRYRDGDDEAIMASHLVWQDGEGTIRMEQDVIAALIPMDGSSASDISEGRAGEYAVEFQLVFRPGDGRASVTLEQTNFGFLAVRVAKSLSAYFGGGRLTNAEGLQGESRLHETASPWMDYSGPIAVGSGQGRTIVEEGITYFDHVDNPSFPTFWHVRDDGWMGAAPGMKSAITVTADAPLTLRYLLHSHTGAVDLERAQLISKQFNDRPGFQIRKPHSGERHRQFEVERLAE